jgi:hypothetical protein
MTSALSELIAWARSAAMTPAQVEAQRRSFAYGNTAIGNPRLAREIVDRAADELFVLERLIGLQCDALAFYPSPLTQYERIVLGVLLAQPTVTRGALFDALYALRPVGDQPSSLKVVDQFVMRLRRKLAPRGIGIVNLRAKLSAAEGQFMISAADKAKLRAILVAHGAKP